MPTTVLARPLDLACLISQRCTRSTTYVVVESLEAAGHAAFQLRHQHRRAVLPMTTALIKRQVPSTQFALTATTTDTTSFKVCAHTIPTWANGQRRMRIP